MRSLWQRMALEIIEQDLKKEYLQALLEGDMEGCRSVVLGLLDQGIPIPVLYRDLFHDTQYEIGLKWQRNEISVAREHIATSITEMMLNLVYPHLFRGLRKGKSALVTAGANEFHQLGGKMVADIFELNGWRGYFLGANTSNAQLLEAVEKHHPDLLAFSVSIPDNLPRLREMIKATHERYPHIPGLVGGRAVALHPDSLATGLPDNYRIMTSLEALVAYLEADS